MTDRKVTDRKSDRQRERQAEILIAIEIYKERVINGESDMERGSDIQKE